MNLLSVSHAQGLLVDSWSMLLRWAFGWGAFLAALAMIALGVVLLLRNLEFLLTIPRLRIAGVVLVFLGLLGMFHFFYPDPARLAQEGRGGGYVGWAISTALYESLGDIGAFLVLLLICLAGLTLSARITPSQMRNAALALRTLPSQTSS